MTMAYFRKQNMTPNGQNFWAESDPEMLPHGGHDVHAVS